MILSPRATSDTQTSAAPAPDPAPSWGQQLLQLGHNELAPFENKIVTFTL